MPTDGSRRKDEEKTEGKQIDTLGMVASTEHQMARSARRSTRREQAAPHEQISSCTPPSIAEGLHPSPSAYLHSAGQVSPSDAREATLKLQLQSNCHSGTQEKCWKPRPPRLVKPETQTAAPQIPAKSPDDAAVVPNTSVPAEVAEHFIDRLSHSEHGSLRCFVKADRSHAGSVDAEEFTAVSKELKVRLNDQQLYSLFHQLASKSDGRLHYKNLLQRICNGARVFSHISRLRRRPVAELKPKSSISAPASERSDTDGAKDAVPSIRKRFIPTLPLPDAVDNDPQTTIPSCARSIRRAWAKANQTERVHGYGRHSSTPREGTQIWSVLHPD